MTETSEVYPSGTLLKDTRATELLLAREAVAAVDAKSFLFLSEHSKNLEKTDPLLQLGAHARIDLKKIHKLVGVDLSDKDMPFVFVVPEENWNVVRAKYGQKEEFVEGFSTQDGRVVVVREGEDLLMTARTMYHEMVHGVGRIATVVSPERIHKGQQGYVTFGSSTRGLALEEGIAEYFSLEFISKVSMGELSRARDKVTRKWYGDEVELTPDLERMAIATEMMIGTPTTYNIAKNLVTRLIDVGGDEMKDLLLGSRVDVSKRRKLVETINEKFTDKSAASKIFKTQFNERDMADTMIWLYGKMDTQDEITT